MKVDIHSREAIEKLLQEGFPAMSRSSAFTTRRQSGTTDTVFSRSTVDYSAKTDRVFAIAVHDIEMQDLGGYHLTYETYLPEADDLARFIYEAQNDGLNIICQCEYGQSRSAGCAAAIEEHFYSGGITIFSDHRYYPNRLVYHKVFDALKKQGKDRREVSIWEPAEDYRIVVTKEEFEAFKAQRKEEYYIHRTHITNLNYLMGMAHIGSNTVEDTFLVYVNPKEGDGHRYIKVYDNLSVKQAKQVIRLSFDGKIGYVIRDTFKPWAPSEVPFKTLHAWFCSPSQKEPRLTNWQYAIFMWNNELGFEMSIDEFLNNEIEEYKGQRQFIRPDTPKPSWDEHINIWRLRSED